MWRFRLSDEDREKYGGPEWVEYRLDKAVELDTELLEQIEDATGYTVMGTLIEALDRNSLRAVRAVVWIARHCAGVHEPPFHEFRPKIMAGTLERMADAVPPEEPPNRAARRSSARKATSKRTAPRSGTS